MSMRTLDGLDVAGKRVLVRVDFNVPIEHGVIQNDARIRAAVPTIQRLLAGGAAVILVSHLGRPKGKPDPSFSLRPVALRLSELLGEPVQMAADVVGPDATQLAGDIEPGEVLLLENVRFEPGEESNDPELARALASMADIFVSDAFGAAHRAHASTVGVGEVLPAYAGDLMIAEVEALRRLTEQPEHPFVAILGGAKISDKIGVIERLFDTVDAILVGGGMANTFLLAEGKAIGDSLAEADQVETARRTLQRAVEIGVRVVLPTDVVAAPSLDGQAAVVPSDAIPDGWAAYDIGPSTIGEFRSVIETAKTIFWNGPMGVFERPAFANGTLETARAVAESGAFSVVGGGDSVSALERSGVADRISHISTGGGASLEFIEGRTLPGVAILEGDPR